VSDDHGIGLLLGLILPEKVQWIIGVILSVVVIGLLVLFYIQGRLTW
jgi:hypothetical protein